ncbi:choice-of-anchor Q domain-containing protein [Chloroflexota bacterium]
MARWSRPQLTAVALRGIALPLFLVALFLLPSSSAAQAVLFIVDSPNDSGLGSLRQAILDANNYGGYPTIMFDLAPYPRTITLVSTLPAVTNDLEIIGPGADKLTISGNNLVRVLELAYGAELTLEGLTIANGFDTSAGGGIYCQNSSGPSTTSLTITDCVFSGNRVIGSDDKGGAIYFDVWSPGTLTISGSTFANNEAHSVVAYGGAIYTSAATSVANSTFVGNKTNPTLDWGWGGAIYAGNAGLTMTHCTLYGNTSTPGANSGGETGAIHAGATVPVTLVNTIIADNPGGNCWGTITNGGGNLQRGDTTCGATIPVFDPGLLPLADNGGSTPTMALPLGSPAVDACACAGLTTDQRGEPRPFDWLSVDNGDVCDIGAFEKVGAHLYLSLVLRAAP